ncbi:YlbF family regulator [Rummeliibacillus pycnus]|uniref:YlbF family regulator n=1 Tax=Rummeliibacillus pycnus TaxID=101070 RepID=UPI000C9CB15C|nr:YlbF family regulator [Rummeliibacillus pycnus]
MNNIYNEINALEGSFRKTNEFKALEEATTSVKADADAKALFQNFRKVQLSLQEKQMKGEQIGEDELQYAQKTAQLAQQNEKIAKMLQAEMALSGLIEEINRVLVKPIQGLYKELD